MWNIFKYSAFSPVYTHTARRAETAPGVAHPTSVRGSLLWLRCSSDRWSRLW